MKTIAIYGKGGIGKSTTSSNLSAAISLMGQNVAQIGCDPKHDSVANLIKGKKISTILEQIDASSGRVTEKTIESAAYYGYNNILCIESGGPRPGRGCAGKGVFLALSYIKKFKILEKKNIAFALYDVLGDTVCGGFAEPVRAGYADQVYIITCGEPLALFQTNNIAAAIANNVRSGKKIGLAGIINNMRGFAGEREIVDKFAHQLGVPVIEHIPRSEFVQRAEFNGMTVIEAYPTSEQADKYRSLASKILDNDQLYQPNVLGMTEIKKIMKEMRDLVSVSEDYEEDEIFMEKIETL